MCSPINHRFLPMVEHRKFAALHHLRRRVGDERLAWRARRQKFWSKGCCRAPKRHSAVAEGRTSMVPSCAASSVSSAKGAIAGTSITRVQVWTTPMLPRCSCCRGLAWVSFHYDQQLRDWGARRYPLLSKLVLWGGLLPVPAFAKAIIRVWWNLLRNPKTIQRMIKLVYADSSVVDDKLIRQMLEATDHPAAFAAFASILFAPRAHTDFGQNLISLKEMGTPMCLIYGKEDPWVVPFWGQRAKQRNPDAVYYELSPAGHCPHHEAPEVVNTVVRKWVESVQSEGAFPPPLLDGEVNQ